MQLPVSSVMRACGGAAAICFGLNAAVSTVTGRALQEMKEMNRKVADANTQASPMAPPGASNPTSQAAAPVRLLSKPPPPITPESVAASVANARRR